uniref:Telomeric single stranded DNA binding POT1/Cdc13 domain-containing protein n=1 Tax=Kwoniella bestiolae CBS 10118 TaxID=1296100 RepID=A0A1B9G6M0_9TREE|nr:hypothetical protein I302_04352 [Kwoniella bestiolae CBS 10118]OCF26665.1 hypothetical protein I302_04352 [Kwoniella bestiolae CBS 10118]
MTQRKRPKRSFTPPKTTSLNYTHFIVGTILPPTRLTGKISIVWGKNVSSQVDIPRVSFSINQKYTVPVGYQPNDYVVATDKERVDKYEIKINIYHSQYNNNTKDERMKNDIVEMSRECREWTTSLDGREIMVDTTGMEVVKKGKRPDDEKVDLVELEFIGEREIRYENGRKVKKIMPEIPKPSQAPEWFNLDSSAPTVSSPVQPTSQLPLPPTNNNNTPTSKNGESSKLRPLTSFHPPDLTRQPSRSSSSSHTSNLPRPVKRPSSEQEKESNKRVKGNEDSSVEDSEKERRKEPRTIVQLGPPGFQAFIDTVTSPVSASRKDKEQHQPISLPRTSSSTALPIANQAGTNQPLAEDSSPNPPHPSLQSPAQITPPVVHTASQQSNQQPTDPAKPAIHTSTPVPPAHSTPSAPENMPPFRSPSISVDLFNPTHATTSPSYPSRRQSIPPISQSSPSAFTPRAERERLSAARREAEERRRGEIQAAQAESSRAAEARAEDVKVLERPLLTNDSRVCNVLGVVVQFTEVKHPRDYMMSVVLCDPTRHARGDPAFSEELVVTIFRGQESELPTDVSIGSVILFRGVKVKMFGNKTKAQSFSNSNSTWAVLKNGKEVKHENQIMYPPLNTEEVDRMVGLFNWHRDLNRIGHGHAFGMESSPGLSQSDTPSRRSSVGPGTSRGDITLAQVTPAIFFDAVFKIMHVVRNNHRKPVLELYISDGTICTEYPIKNYHNIQIAGLPNEAVWTLAIHELPDIHELPKFDVGNILKAENVRSKLYNGEMELSWSELPTSDQARQGWRKRKCILVDGDDKRAKAIERRLRTLKRGDTIDEPQSSNRLFSVDTFPPVQPTTPQRVPVSNASHSNTTYMENTQTTNQPIRPPQLATHLRTIHTNEMDHPLSSISNILDNSTVPNKYRIIAQVKSIISRSPSGDIIQAYCKHCKMSFKNDWTWCLSCNDTEGEYAEWKYRFLVVLVDQRGMELVGLVGDDEAAEFLPPLPPWSNSTNPNDIRKSERRRHEITAHVYNTLQGAKMDGIRTKPFIEMSLEVYHVIKPFTGGIDEQDEQQKVKVIVARMFGMRGNSV